MFPSDPMDKVEASLRGVASNPENWLKHYFLAVAYEGSGRLEDAIPEHEKAVQPSDLPYFLKADLRVDSLRSNPRYAELLNKMRLAP